MGWLIDDELALKGDKDSSNIPIVALARGVVVLRYFLELLQEAHDSCPAREGSEFVQQFKERIGKLCDWYGLYDPTEPNWEE